MGASTGGQSESVPGAHPRLVATDLDGTLLRSDHTVSARTRRALAAVEEAGALLVPVTGRPVRWLAPIAEETGHRGLAICANGAVLYDLAAERVLHHTPFADDDVAAVVAALREAMPELRLGVERPDGYAHERGYREDSDALVADDAELLAGPVVKLLARHGELDADALLSRVRTAVGARATPSHSGGQRLVEIAAAGVSKAAALERLCVERGIPARDVIAFGDMPNDLPMLSWAGRAVAVANAHPDVIAAADETTAANDEDGVARVLERYFAATGPA